MDGWLNRFKLSEGCKNSKTNLTLTVYWLLRLLKIQIVGWLVVWLFGLKELSKGNDVNQVALLVHS